MQKRMFVVLLAALVLGAATLLTATDNSMAGVALKQEITFSAPTVVGGSLLPAGEYKITHEMQGTEHIMIFKQIGGKAEAKAKCNLVPLTGKAKTTETALHREREERARTDRNDLPRRYLEARAGAVKDF